MSTKILCWNIQNFTSNKIDPDLPDDYVVVPLQIGGLDFKTKRFSTMKLDYILNNVTTIDPDVFIVIEVISGRGPKGSLVSSKGQQGILTLLKKLRVLDPNWCLVPPQKLTNEVQVSDKDDKEDLSLLSEGGYTEAIGVFYKSNKLDFTGPFIWPTAPDNDTSGKQAVPAGSGVPGPYPDVFSTCLPAANYFAGQTVFKTDEKPPKEIYFPAETSRRPFLTTFVEKTGTLRKLSIFSVHYPPQPDSAKSAAVKTLEYLTKYYKMIPNEISVLIGDFNVDYNTDNLNIFGLFTMYGLVPLFPAFSQNKIGTMYKNKTKATYASYMKPLGLDNAVLRYGGQIALGITPTAAVIDRVNTSVLGQPSMMYNSYAQIGMLPPVKRDEIFLREFNYVSLGPAPGTSDHMPIYIEF